MSQQRKLILGGPGCGKTTALLQLVEEHIEAGIQPNEIAFVAFTRKAATEARERACEKFGLKETELPFFRTLHSFAFMELGLGRNELLTADHYDELGEILKVKFGALEDEFGIMLEQKERGSQYYHIENQARLRCISLRNMCQIDGRQGIMRVANYQEVLKKYKIKHSLFDYTDILESWNRNIRPLPIKVLIVDEAQDLCPLQWQLVHKIEQDVPFVYYAGDDDQAIYQWTGADINHFLNLNAERIILPISYRLPKVIYNKCNSVVKRIKRRYEKNWSPANREGIYRTVVSPELVNLDKGEWMVLARNHYQLAFLASYLKSKGHVFQSSNRSSLSSPDALAVKAWLWSKDSDMVAIENVKRIIEKVPRSYMKSPKEQLYSLPKESLVPKAELKETYGIDLDRSWELSLALRPEEHGYVKAIIAKHGSLDVESRIKLNTIHAVKGGECDNVMLLPDMASSCYNSFIKDVDNETRVFYVGLSRAREQLVVCQPQTKLFYPL